MTTFGHLQIEGHDYAIGSTQPVVRVELVRTINSVGSWEVVMRNIGGVYNNTFDVQDDFWIYLNGANLMMQGVVDGPAVTLRGKDLESIWDEYVTIRGVDMAQDLLFHNDYDADFPDTAQRLHDVMSTVFNTLPPFGIANITNINYTPPAWSPFVGSFEFREGASFITQLQELVCRAGYIFYVDDTSPPVLRCGAPGFSAAPAPSIFKSIAGDPTNNIIDVVDYQNRDGDKHYNYVKLYGKAPMFDGYTEYNATDWNVPNALGAGSTTDVLDDTTTKMVGGYSIVSCSDATTTSYIGMRLDAPVYNYTSWDLRQGEIGGWFRYDNTAGAPGSAPPNAGSADVNEYVWCALTDSAGNSAYYYGDATFLYRDTWGYCTFPLGENNYAWIGGLINTWTLVIGTALDWEHIVSIEFVLALVGNDGMGGPGEASHFYLDGLSLPFAILAIAPTAAVVVGEPSFYPAARTAQTSYRKRPYVDSWPHVRTQNALAECARVILEQSYNTYLGRLKFKIPGVTNLKYAGQTIQMDIPPLGINNDIFYITQLHHVIEPGVDVSGGYGFDWITEVECLPTAGIAYHNGRLNIGPMYSTYQKTDRLGAGVR